MPALPTEHVEAAPGLLDPGKEGIDRVLVGDVGGREQVLALGAKRHELLDQQLGRLGIADDS